MDTRLTSGKELDDDLMTEECMLFFCVFLKVYSWDSEGRFTKWIVNVLHILVAASYEQCSNSLSHCIILVGYRDHSIGLL